ncbi:DUF1990 domain-containing protein [Pseudonocardia benzenivorans]|uniref:DUF1990 domain-containing protein n=2 Tax=Pseudonocardia TaxID=1847 RepID=F4CT10_PSEUX|nr:DUF1990 domain-containing protein [Pseudonocardia dioxanivorans]AEA25309.1 Domain of unknown function DUF1990-containing protein [Pseudonocardia dioxanivorans CB1190]GJF03720.1 hypothetical protein PSD17_26800 [Pseudonocardia sp. D17]
MNARGLVTELDRLAELAVNYDESEAPRGPDDPDWHVDVASAQLGTEPPGDPVPGGIFESACVLVRDYEFSDHRLIRGVFRPADELLGRNMLLEGRFLFLRFYLGVRVTAVVDGTRECPDGPQRVWGWTYQTLDGHLEQGKLTYEVVKDLTTGVVCFRLDAYSRRAPIENPVLRTGFQVFGRRTQLDFYRRVGQRMHDLLAAHEAGAPLPHPARLAGDVVLAPSASRMRPWDPFALPLRHPGVHVARRARKGRT